MLDGFLKSKFHNKCKTNLKLMKTRVETTKKKKNAVQKFLKNDIADLLRNGLDVNAFNRAEGFLVEQNMTACYELIENYCGCISSNLSLMHKQRECAEECREAVSTLIYAAARFADLPELRDLRNVFAERYGNSLDSYTSKEFMERLKQKDFTKEMKLQLLQDIAKEFSIEWNSKALEQKLFTPPPVQNQSKYASLGNNDDESYRSHNQNKEAAFARRNAQEPVNKPSNMKNYAASEETKVDLISRHSKNVSRDRYKLQSSSEDETITDFSKDSRKTSSSSAGSEDDPDSIKPSYHKVIRPPYLKLKPERSLAEPPKLNGHFDQEEANNLQDDPGEENKQKPRSVRQRNLKPPPGYNGNSSGAKQETRRSLRNMNNNDPRDEEEKKIDGLLMHYSNKKSPYQHGESNTSRHNRSKTELANPPGRVSSFPLDPTSPAATRGPQRATSLQPETLSGANHVHPKLPADYDDLAARIAALRGK